MKMDVVGCFYRQHEYWPFFLWGLEQNRESIGQVFVVNDELWSECEAVDPVPEWMTLLDHEHRGWGALVSTDQGVEAARTENVMMMACDQVLVPGALEMLSKHAGPKKLVFGTLLNLEVPAKLEDFPNPAVRPTKSSRCTTPEIIRQLRELQSVWWLVRAGRVVHRDSFLAIGGHEPERYLGGQGWDDQDAGIRWEAAFGAGSVVPIPIVTNWHFANPHTVEPSIEMRAYSVNLAAELLYGYQYQLFVGKWKAVGCVAVAHDKNRVTGSVGEFPMDCVRPDWLPDGKVNLIWDPAPSSLIDDVPAHFELLHAKLNENGRILTRLGVENELPDLDLFDWELQGQFLELTKI